jgi:hypothetical protein
MSLSFLTTLTRRNLMKPPQKTSGVAKVSFLLSLVILAAFSINGMLSAGRAQESGERELEDRIPKHVPIRVKIKKEKEKEVKNLKNDKWLGDFQLEITNTGDKPIYFLSLALSLPDVTTSDGTTVGFSIHYGRSQLGDIKTKAEAEDVPIKPGEAYVFSFREIEVTSWERFKQREKKTDPKKLILHFQIMSFGDGTGLWRSDGIPSPRAPGDKSSLSGCKPRSNLAEPGMKALQVPWHSQRATYSPDVLPATFLLANFLSPSLVSRNPINPSPQSQLCCSGQ